MDCSGCGMQKVGRGEEVSSGQTKLDGNFKPAGTKVEEGQCMSMYVCACVLLMLYKCIVSSCKKLPIHYIFTNFLKSSDVQYYKYCSTSLYVCCHFLKCCLLCLKIYTDEQLETLILTRTFSYEYSKLHSVSKGQYPFGRKKHQLCQVNSQS